MSLCDICLSMMSQISEDRCTQCGRVIKKERPKCICDYPGDLFTTITGINNNVIAEKFKASFCPKCGEKV